MYQYLASLELVIDNIIFISCRYSPRKRAKIGAYASTHGAAAAAKRFSKELGHVVKESTVKSIQNSYREASDKQRKATGNSVLISLPEKKRERTLLLGDSIDRKLQLYLKVNRANGGPVTAGIAIAAARGLVLAENRNKLFEYGGHIKLNRSWAYSLFGRMGLVQRKPTTSKSRVDWTDFATQKKAFLDDLVMTVEMEEIPPGLILNWDQTGIRLVPAASTTMEQRGVKRVEVVGQNDKRLITAVFCGSLQGDFLPLQLIYKGKTSRCHPHYEFPSGWHITQSPNHWSTETTMVQYIEHIIEPYVRSVWEIMYTATTPGVIIIDNFKGQVTEKITTLLEKCNLHVCLLPANTTDLLQPMDISVNKPAKSFLRKQFAEWYSEQLIQQIQTQPTSNIDDVVLEPVDLSMGEIKHVSAQWLVKMWEYIMDNPQFIVNGFIRSGICRALDGVTSDDELDDLLEKMDSASDTSETSSLSDDEIRRLPKQ